jgi:hypothetical protein
MTLPQKAIMRDEKFIMMDKKKVLIAAKGSTVTIYNVDHHPVYLCTNQKGETFSCNQNLLTTK